MNLTRRKFFGVLSTALVGTYTTLHIPPSWLPRTLKQGSVQTYLTQQWNRVTKGTGILHTPSYIFVSQELFEAFEGELTFLTRWTDSPTLKGPRTLLFKSTKMRIGTNLKGWDLAWGWKD